ncbi:MAG: hypothetical protein ACM3YN_01180 [Parcubacteria group bacterium]
MNRLMLLAAGVAALSLGACHREVHRAEVHGPLKTVSRLDCPEAQGQLKRVSAAPDGLTCAYEGDDTEVTLRLVSLTDGDAQAALSPIEADLKSLMPAPNPPTVPTPAGTESKTENVAIDFPGLQVHANDGGAQVRVGGINVDADDNGAQVRMGGNTAVNADQRGAEIRQGRSDEAGFRSTFILASDKMTSGYHVVGYEARGPKAGPLVVAVVKSRAEHNDRSVFNDMKALVKKNVGG